MTGDLTLELFVSRVGETFDLQLEGRTCSLTLAEVSESDLPLPPVVTRKAFALLFQAPRDAQFGQGIVSLHHATLGELTLSLTPVLPSSEGPRYEAVFN